MSEKFPNSQASTPSDHENQPGLNRREFLKKSLVGLWALALDNNGLLPNEAHGKAPEKKEKIEKIVNQIVSIIDKRNQDSFRSRNEAEQSLLNTLKDIHAMLSGNGVKLPEPIINDIDLRPNNEGFTNKLVGYLGENGYFFMVGLNTINEDQEERTLTTVSLNKIGNKLNERLESYIPAFLSLNDFNGTDKNTEKQNTEILVVEKGINQENGLIKHGALGGIHIYGKIVVFKDEIKQKFAQENNEEINKIIKNIVIPNEMGHVYGEAVGLDLNWQEPISDIFSMNRLEKKDLYDFIVGRLQAAKTMRQYGTTAALIGEAIRDINLKTGQSNIMDTLNDVSYKKETRLEFLKLCADKLKEVHKAYKNKEQ